jgi:hypothetical protein
VAQRTFVAILFALGCSSPSRADEPTASNLHHALFDLDDSGPTTLARLELVAGQTLHGFALGMASCNLAPPCPDGDTSPGAGLAGAVIGGGLSFFLSYRGIRPGQALAVNAGTLWGAAEGLFLSTAINDGNPSVGAMVGMVLGTASGALLALMLQPSASQVALVDTCALWVSVMTVVASLTATISGYAIGISEVVALNVALAGGAILSQYAKLSRARLFVIDGGGILGMLAGFAGAVAVPSTLLQRSSAIQGIIFAVLTLAGLGTATYLTQGFDSPAELPQMSLLPASLGRPGLSLAGTF